MTFALTGTKLSKRKRASLVDAVFAERTRDRARHIPQPEPEYAIYFQRTGSVGGVLTAIPRVSGAGVIASGPLTRAGWAFEILDAPPNNVGDLLGEAPYATVTEAIQLLQETWKQQRPKVPERVSQIYTALVSGACGEEFWLWQAPTQTCAAPLVL